MAKRTEYEKLCQRLGELDKERRVVLSALRKSPEFIVKYVNDTLTAFVTQQKWFKRLNAKGEESYFRLQKFTINGGKAWQSDRGSVLLPIKLEWDYYDYNAIEKKQNIENVSISAFNEIERQVLNGRLHAEGFNEKSIHKKVLTARKKELEEQLKKVKSDLALV